MEINEERQTLLEEMRRAGWSAEDIEAAAASGLWRIGGAGVESVRNSNE